MLDFAHFSAVLSALAETMPFGKAIGREGAILAWQTVPPKAKAEISNGMWSYAASQYVLDPERPKEVPVFLALLRYLYRLENGSPNFDWGLKADLPERMANGSVFHPQPMAPYLMPSDEHDGPIAPGLIEGLNHLFTLPGS